MKILHLVLIFGICTLCTFSAKSGCTTKLNEVSIFPTTNEILTWHIKSDFFDGPDLTYTLSDTSKQFSIINPIQQNGGDQSHAAVNVIATKAATIQSNGFWLNTFALLEKTDSAYFIYIAEGHDAKTAPQFNQKYLITQLNQMTCYDVDFLDVETYIVDCQRKVDKDNSTTLQNVLFIKPKNGQVLEFAESAIFSAYKQRYLGSYSKKNSLGITHQYLFRITPAYSISLDSELAQDSLIETYLIQNGIPQNTNFVLDSASLAYALGKPSIAFSLVDFQILPNGDIFLLDAFNGIYVVNFLPNGEWLIKQQINPQTGQAFAFAINSFIKQDDSLAQVIVVQGYNFFVHIENNELLYIYDLPFTQLDYPSYIGLSQENVILKKGNLAYLYNVDSDSIELNSKFTLGTTDFILLNPFLPDLITVTSKLAKRYTLSMGYLKYLGNATAQDKKQITLTATAPNKQQCQVKITYQILEDRDIKIYPLKENQKPFPQAITEDNTYSSLEQLASGPNLQYSQKTTLQESSVNFEVKNKWTLEPQVQWPTNTIYADVLVLEEQTQFYQIIQTDDLNLHIWLCDHASQYDAKATCLKLVDKLALGVKITRQTFTLWRHDLTNIFFMYLDTEYSVTIKYYLAGELKVFKKIIYDQKIKSIFFAENHFYVIRSDNVILAYSTYSHETDVLGIADADSFAHFGYTYEWKPQRLFGNRKLHPNLLFILNEDNIVLVDFHSEFTFLQQFGYTKGLDVEMAIAEDTFFIVYGQTLESFGKVEEYDFSRINNIFKTKSIQLYWYRLPSPLVVDQSEENGKLFVRAMCTYSKLPHILVFSPDTLQHDSLFQAFSIFETKSETDKVIMAVDGHQQMFLYTFCKGETVLSSVLNNAVLIIKPQINQQEYSTKIDATLQISNYAFPEEQFNKVDIKQQVQVFYTQTKISINKDRFKNGINIDSYVKNKVIDIGTDWFTGQVTGMQLECEQCKTNVELQNIMESVNPSIFNGYEIRDLIRYDDHYNIFQATKGLIFTTHDNEFAAAYDFDLPSSTYRCYQAQVSADKLIIYSLCQDKGQYTIYATGCLSITGCSPLGEKFQFESAAKIQLIGNEFLAVLHTNSRDPEEIDGSIILYQIKIGLKQWNLEILDVITFQSLNAKLTDKLEYFRPSDFEIVKQYSNQGNYYYKILISNSLSGLVFYDFEIVDSQVYRYLFAESFDLSTYLNDINQYALSDTHYLQIRLLDQIQFQDFETMIAQLLIQTNNVAQYALQITFKKTLSSYSKLNDTKLLFVLNRYKNWPSINKLAVHNNKILVPYVHDNRMIIGLYDTYEAKKQYTIVGATYLDYVQGQYVLPINMALFFHLDDDNYFYATQLQGALRSFQIRDIPSIKLTNHGDLNNQTLTLIVQNDFSVDQVEFKLTVRPVDMNECSAKVTNVHIYPSTNEILEWQLNDGLFQGVGLRYNLNENVDFSIVEPLQLIKSNKNRERLQGLSSLKALNVQNVWTNKFAVFAISPVSNILYFTSTPSLNFDSNIIVDPEAPGIECFDFDYANQNNEFLIDCQLNNEKRLYWGSIDTLKVISTLESPFDINTQRYVSQITIEEKVYLIRVTPAYSVTEDKLLGKQSLIELFLLEGQTVTLKSVIDNQKLAKLLNKENVNFVLVDYKVKQHSLHILDAENGLIVLNYSFELKDWVVANQQANLFPNPIAFDRDDYINNKGQSVTHTVILYYNFFIVIEDQKIIKIQDLDFYLSTYPQQIQISQKYIFIQNQNYLYMYYFNDDYIFLVDVQAKEGVILANKNAQEIVQVDKATTNQYTFSKGALKYEYKSQQVREGQLVITATSYNNQKCVSQIKYTIVKGDDQNVYKTTDSIPSVLTETSDYNLGDLASGPNLVYQIKDNEKVAVVQSKKINYSGIDKKDLLFADAIELNQITYYFVQPQDKNLFVYDCNLFSDKTDKCRQVLNVQATISLNQQLFNAIVNSSIKFQFLVVDSLYSIKLYEYAVYKFDLVKSKEFEQKEEEQILAQLLLKENIVILQKGGYLSSYSYTDLKLLNKIKGEQLIGYTGNWSPKALFGNSVLKPTLFFIQNEDNIVIVNHINNQFLHVKTIGYTKENSIYITLSENTFFIVENSKISEYNYENLFNIFKIKDVLLFNQKLSTPLNARYQRSTGNLLITTKNKEDKTQLSIFKPGKVLHDTNYYVESFVELDDQRLFAASGEDEMLVNFFRDVSQVVHQIYQQPQLQIQTASQKYLESVKVKLTISNSYVANNEIEFEQEIKLINTLTIYPSGNYTYEAKIDNNEPRIYVVDPKPTQLTHTPHSELKVLYPKENSIRLIQFLQPNKNICEQYKVNYGYAYKKLETKSQYLYLQASNTMLLASVQDENINIQEAEYKLNDNYHCFRLDDYDKIFYSICNNGVENELLIVNCEKTCQLESSYIAQQNGVSLLAIHKQLVAILHTHPQTPQDYSGYVTIQYLSKSEDVWASKTLLTVDLKFIKEKLGDTVKNFRPSSIQGVLYEKTKYKLIITDSLTGLVVLDFGVDDGKINYNSIELIPLTKWLNENNQYALDNTVYLQTKIIKTEEKDEKLTVNLVVLTSNASTYLIQLVFQKDKPIEKTIKYAFVRYGDWDVLNYLVANENSVVIPYYSEKRVTVGIYAITQNETLSVIRGGYSFELKDNEELSPLNFLLLEDNNLFLSSVPNKLGVSQYRRFPFETLFIDNPQDQQNQDLKINYSNDFSTVQEIFSLEIIPIDDGSSGLGIGWIILIVLGTLVALSLMGYFYYKYKAPQEEEPLI